MIRFFAAPAFLTLAATCFAQGTTWVVDAAMGQGAHYRDLPAAVARAVDGDKIIVRKGGYTQFTLTRGVTIVGQPGVMVGGYQTKTLLSNVPAGRTAALHNIEFGYVLEISKCKGRVILDHVAMSPRYGGYSGVVMLDSPQVFLLDSVTRGLYARDSRLIVTNSRLGGGSSGSTMVHFSNSEVTMAGCAVTGGSFSGSAAAAIRMNSGSVLTLTDDGSSIITVGASTNSSAASAIAGSGTILLDPRVVLKSTSNAPSIASGIKVSRRTVPYLEARGAPLGGTVNVMLRAGANHPFFLALGLKGKVTSIPSLGGSVWLDLNSAILVAAGNLDAKGEYAWSIPVPRNNVLFGLPIVWQGTAGPSLSQQLFSNPSAYVHGF